MQFLLINFLGLFTIRNYKIFWNRVFNQRKWRLLQIYIYFFLEFFQSQSFDVGNSKSNEKRFLFNLNSIRLVYPLLLRGVIQKPKFIIYCTWYDAKYIIHYLIGRRVRRHIKRYRNSSGLGWLSKYNARSTPRVLKKNFPPAHT